MAGKAFAVKRLPMTALPGTVFSVVSVGKKPEVSSSSQALISVSVIPSRSVDSVSRSRRLFASNGGSAMRRSSAVRPIACGERGSFLASKSSNEATVDDDKE
jgi:hypothetical protein